MSSNIQTPGSTKVSLRLLRRLADRAVRVLNRHGAAHPALSVLVETVVPTAQAYVHAYDGVRALARTERLELDAGLRAVGELRVVLRTWLGTLRAALPGFSEPAVAASAMPDDVLAAASRVVALLERERGREPVPAWLPACLQTLTTTHDAATQQWNAAQTLLGSRQESRAELRRRATAFQQQLVGLRRTLRAVLGKTHRDFQTLRITAAGLNEPEDEVVDLDDEDQGVGKGALRAIA